MRALTLALVLAFSGGCSFEPTKEDRQRVDALTAELRQMNVKLEEYKDRIDRLNRALDALSKLGGIK